MRMRMISEISQEITKYTPHSGVFHRCEIMKPKPGLKSPQIVQDMRKRTGPSTMATNEIIIILTI